VLDFAKLAKYFKLDAVITGNTNENIVFDKKNILLLKAECDDEDDPEL
jgi:putative cofactor-binding repeat protein